jgi:hypothetical protein
LKAVVFDFGYTLVDEDRVWKAAANELGWPQSVFFAALGSVIEQRRRHRDVLEILGGDGRQRLAPFEPRDFYEDALPTLKAAKKGGLIVGIAGISAGKSKHSSRTTPMSTSLRRPSDGASRSPTRSSSRESSATPGARPQTSRTSATGSTTMCYLL